MNNIISTLFYKILKERLDDTPIIFWNDLGEIAISPIYFANLLHCWPFGPNTIFVFTTTAISPKYFVTYPYFTKYFDQNFINNFGRSFS